MKFIDSSNFSYEDIISFFKNEDTGFEDKVFSYSESIGLNKFIDNFIYKINY